MTQFGSTTPNARLLTPERLSLKGGEQMLEEMAFASSESSPGSRKFLNVIDADGCSHEDEWITLRSLGADADEIAGMIVGSNPLRELMARIIRVAPHPGTVLIHGESGTGKELVAQALHRLGPQPDGPFVIFNCSNLVGSLAEAQLFGHVRGAFTDAREDSLGYFRAADGGTLFLDEIGELPLALQPKLLRVVENYEVQPVGSIKSHKVRVRLVAATNRDLGTMIKEGSFRDDLYYRLTGSNLEIPPLRDRHDDIRALLAHFIGCYNRLFEKNVHLVSRRVLDLLELYPWPGNVRELANTVQSAVMMTSGERLCLADFPHLIMREAAAEPGGAAEPAFQTQAPANELRSLRDSANLASKNALLQALHETRGNCTRAAQRLGVSRFTVYRLITRYGLSRRGLFDEPS